MTRLLPFFLALAVSAASADELTDRLAAVPNPRVEGGWVADPAGVIASRTSDINRLLTTLEQKTGAEVAVVVLPSIGNFTPKDFAVRLVEKWGVGKKDRDNGVLVLHVLDQRRIEIETGYGMEAILPDVKCRWITEKIATPFFRSNSFADGHYEVVRALIRGIEDPTIKQAALISQWETQPGARVDIPPADEGERRGTENDSVPAKDRSTLGLATSLVLFGIGAAIYFAVARNIRARSSGKSLYEQYQVNRSGFARWQYAATVPTAAAALIAEQSLNHTAFSPIPVLLALAGGMLWRRNKTLRALRDAPRTCHCGRPMRRAGEREDDAFIEAGNVVEEEIRSMDYDVWLCDEGHSSIEAYSGNSSAATDCPNCKFKTFRAGGTRTIKAATTSSSGLSETTYTCAHCNHIKKETTVIPKVTPASTSRSGSSSGRGGSFGGGRSGGGGAGSSY